MRRLVGILAVAVLGGACTPSSPGTGEAPSPPSTSPSAQAPATPGPLQGSRRVRFEALDGIRLDGRLFGKGRVGVVLSHMGRPGDTQEDWWPLAGLLADRGYLVLTYDRRGVCPGGRAGCSEGEDDFGTAWKDVGGAVAMLRRRGGREVVAAGASIGAMTSIFLATRGRPAVDGVVAIAGIDEYEARSLVQLVPRIDVPALYVAGRHDGFAPDAARAFHRAATTPSWLVLLPTGEHGTDIWAFEDDAVVAGLERAVLSFLAHVT